MGKMSPVADPDDPGAPAPRSHTPPTDDEMSRAAAESARRLTRAAAPKQRKPRRLRSSAHYSDARDPAPLSSLVDQFVREQGWQEQSAVARLMGEWADVVGADVAGHVQPVSFDEGSLVLQAESTAWATQVRLLLPTLQRAIDQALGTGVVTHIDVKGPAAPSWVAGARRVKGRGPRDTYG